MTVFGVTKRMTQLGCQWKGETQKRSFQGGCGKRNRRSTRRRRRRSNGLGSVLFMFGSVLFELGSMLFELGSVLGGAGAGHYREQEQGA